MDKPINKVEILKQLGISTLVALLHLEIVAEYT